MPPGTGSARVLLSPTDNGEQGVYADGATTTKTLRTVPYWAPRLRGADFGRGELRCRGRPALVAARISSTIRSASSRRMTSRPRRRAGSRLEGVVDHGVNDHTAETVSGRSRRSSSAMRLISARLHPCPADRCRRCLRTRLPCPSLGRASPALPRFGPRSALGWVISSSSEGSGQGGGAGPRVSGRTPSFGSSRVRSRGLRRRRARRRCGRAVPHW